MAEKQWTDAELELALTSTYFGRYWGTKKDGL